MAQNSQLSMPMATGFTTGILWYIAKKGTTSVWRALDLMEGGFVATETSSGTTYTPNYFVTDHLGSVRAVVDNSGTVIERSDYYPYGMRWSQGLLSDNRFRYNGKEEQSFVDLPYIDYGARIRDRVEWD